MDTYTTNDISLAAYILASGEQLLEVNSDTPNHFVFVLTNPKRCKELEDSFIYNKPIPIQDFISQRERLISTIKAKAKKARNTNLT